MGTITEGFATGEQIEAIIAKIEPHLIDEPTEHVIITLMSLVVTAMKPSITNDELQHVLREASNFICEMLEAMDDDRTSDKSRMN